MQTQFTGSHSRHERRGGNHNHHDDDLLEDNFLRLSITTSTVMVLSQRDKQTRCNNQCEYLLQNVESDLRSGVAQLINSGALSMLF